MNKQTISFADMMSAQRKAQALANPWTAEDEARVSEKTRLERERNAAWELAHPAPVEDDDEDEEEDEENEEENK